MNIYSNDCRSRSWDRSYCISEKVDVRIGSRADVAPLVFDVCFTPEKQTFATRP